MYYDMTYNVLICSWHTVIYKWACEISIWGLVKRANAQQQISRYVPVHNTKFWPYSAALLKYFIHTLCQRIIIMLKKFGKPEGFYVFWSLNN